MSCILPVDVTHILISRVNTVLQPDWRNAEHTVLVTPVCVKKPFVSSPTAKLSLYVDQFVAGFEVVTPERNQTPFLEKIINDPLAMLLLQAVFPIQVAT